MKGNFKLGVPLGHAQVIKVLDINIKKQNFLKRFVLSRFLKVSKLDVLRSASGSSFLKVGAATPNDRSPRVFLVFHGCSTSSIPLNERKL